MLVYMPAASQDSGFPFKVHKLQVGQMHGKSLMSRMWPSNGISPVEKYLFILKSRNNSSSKICMLTYCLAPNSSCCFCCFICIIWYEEILLCLIGFWLRDDGIYLLDVELTFQRFYTRSYLFVSSGPFTNSEHVSKNLSTLKQYLLSHVIIYYNRKSTKLRRPEF